MSLSSLKDSCEIAEIRPEQTLLRIVQRAAVLSVIPGLENENTYGCLFDFTQKLADAQHFIRNAFICTECQRRILNDESPIPEGRRAEFLHGVQQWLNYTYIEERGVCVGNDTHFTIPASP